MPRSPVPRRPALKICLAPSLGVIFVACAGQLIRPITQESVHATPALTYRSAIGNVFLPGDASRSWLLELVSRRGKGRQMPPLATEEVDERAVATLREWIDGMRR